MTDPFALAREQVSVAAVLLRFAGRELDAHGRCACPICGATNASTFSTNGKLWKCHRCGAGGSVVDLVMRLTQAVKPIDALRTLNEHFHLSLPLDAHAAHSGSYRRQYAQSRERKARQSELAALAYAAITALSFHFDREVCENPDVWTVGGLLYTPADVETEWWRYAAADNDKTALIRGERSKAAIIIYMRLRNENAR